MSSHRRSSAKKVSARRPATTSRRPNGLAKGEKRTPAALHAVTEKLFGYIKKNPGERIETIGRALGIPTSELSLPVKKLREAKRIKVKGDTRATKYSARV